MSMFIATSRYQAQIEHALFVLAMSHPGFEPLYSMTSHSHNNHNYTLKQRHLLKYSVPFIIISMLVFE